MTVAAALLFLALAAGALYAGVTTGRRNTRFRSWPETRARMVRSEVRPYTGPGADPGDRAPVVEYEYTVDGHTYRSGRIYVSGNTAWGGVGATARVERFRRGLHDGVAVRYDPTRPQDAALLPLPAAWPVLLVTIGVLAALAGLAILIGGLP